MRHYAQLITLQIIDVCKLYLNYVKLHSTTFLYIASIMFAKTLLSSCVICPVAIWLQYLQLLIANMLDLAYYCLLVSR